MKEKRLPCPTIPARSTQMRPPIASTNWLLIIEAQASSSLSNRCKSSVFCYAGVHMGLLAELKKTLRTAGAQLTTTSKTPHGIHFTNNFHQKATSWGLSEKDAQDVYDNGSEVKANMIVRVYNGYEIGIYYFKDTLTGQVIITSIWKRDRC